MHTRVREMLMCHSVSHERSVMKLLHPFHTSPVGCFLAANFAASAPIVVVIVIDVHGGGDVAVAAVAAAAAAAASSRAEFTVQ